MTIRSRNIADVMRETELDLAALGGAGGADPFGSIVTGEASLTALGATLRA